MEDVACGDAAFGEAARNQETTMTIERFALGAHQTDARSPRVVEEPVKTSDVAVGRHGFIVGDTVAIEPVVAVATAENVAQCRVTDAGGGERRRRRLLRKPGTKRDCGVLRTSATVSTPAPCRSTKKRSAEMFE